jgi:hypothetical protein
VTGSSATSTQISSPALTPAPSAPTTTSQPPVAASGGS